MKDNYKKNVSLQCVVCGSNSDFESNEDKSYIKCIRCNREYFGGYDEVVELNQELINQEVNVMKDEVTNDLKIEMEKMLKDAFKGNKNMKFR